MRLIPRPRTARFTRGGCPDDVYLLDGDGANIAVQVGPQGAFIVDAGSGKLADKVIAAIARLSAKPVQFIVNTTFRPDHTGGNAKLRQPAPIPA